MSANGKNKGSKMGMDTINKLHSAMAILEFLEKESAQRFANEAGIKHLLGALENAQRYIDKQIDLSEGRFNRRQLHNN